MKDQEFLTWLVDRLVHTYGESPNVDFVQKLKAIAASCGKKDTAWPGPH